MNLLLPILLILIWTGSISARAADDLFTGVQKLFSEHCLDCHAAQDPEGDLVLETFETLMKGGENGPSVMAGKSSESLLVRMIEGSVEKGGKKLIMPPGKRAKLTSDQIKVIRAWIDAGAPPPTAGAVLARDLNVPKISPKVPARKPINAVAWSSSNGLIAAATFGEVTLRSVDTHAVLRTLEGHRGNVNAIVFSKDGSQLFAAGGEAGLFGEILQWNVADGKLIRKIEGHRDAIYSLALSPDGKMLASGSYDQKIKLWSIEDGKELRTLNGHNGAVFGLAFRPDGKILASASADRTVKLWDAQTGERRDTLPQSLKDLYAVAFTPDGQKLVAGGVDNRLRVYTVSEKAQETTNPLILSKFAHEGAILRIAFSADGKSLATSADDKTLKVWSGAEFQEVKDFPLQPDWVSGLAFAADKVIAGRADGTVEFYDAKSAMPAPPAKPELTSVSQRGLQIGKDTIVRLMGKHLGGVQSAEFSHKELTGSIIREQSDATSVQLKVQAGSSLPRGTYEVSLRGPSGKSNPLKVYVDDLPQLAVVGAETRVKELPSAYWGLHDKAGAKEMFRFHASPDQVLIFELTAQALGSKSDAVLTLSDSQGRALASNSGFEGSADPLIAYKFKEEGEYILTVSELMLGASADHFYRLSMGALPVVTGVYPPSVPTASESELQLQGYNLPPGSNVKVSSGQIGEIDVPLPAGFRSPRQFKVAVTGLPLVTESEPNDQPSQATPVSVPGEAVGRIASGKDGPDFDLFKFSAKEGQSLIVETIAAQKGSPVDTRLEILHQDGRPVERVLLQAVRNSAITFRPIDSNGGEARVENWEEMELNEYLYMQGEVTKLFRAPQGPDSAFIFYASNGRRRTYFDTSSIAHALDEPCYIVEPHRPGTKLRPNGLPAFTLYYSNEDDADRKLGTDSRIYFVVPKTGAYLVRVADTRGLQGNDFTYRLLVREPKPDFKATLNGVATTIPAGSGQSFSVNLERLDGFDDEVTVEISGLPLGFLASSPMTVQAGHSEARGTIYALPESVSPTNDAVKIIAKAMVAGKKVSRSLPSFGLLKVGPKPKLRVAFDLASSTRGNPELISTMSEKPLEITIHPGGTIPAWLHVQRNGYDDLVTFTVDNLPHGIIVDNIGLNGVLIPKAESEREIFLTAAKWVPETDRLCFGIENQAGRQTSRPVLLHVRKRGTSVTAK